MGDKLTVKLETEILAIHNETAVVALKLDGRYSEQLLYINLDELEYRN